MLTSIWVYYHHGIEHRMELVKVSLYGDGDDDGVNSCDGISLDSVAVNTIVNEYERWSRDIIAYAWFSNTLLLNVFY